MEVEGKDSGELAGTGLWLVVELEAEGVLVALLGTGTAGASGLRGLLSADDPGVLTAHSRRPAVPSMAGAPSLYPRWKEEMVGPRRCLDSVHRISG